MGSSLLSSAFLHSAFVIGAFLSSLSSGLDLIFRWRWFCRLGSRSRLFLALVSTVTLVFGNLLRFG